MFKLEKEGEEDEARIALANYFLEGLCSERIIKELGGSRLSRIGERFKLDILKMIELCEQVTYIFSKQPMVLRVKAPLKIYGDIHGQYTDLLEFFDIYGSPIMG